jgi:hypothetical protein
MQNATVGTAFSPLAVTVWDALGNPVSGAIVVFSVPASGASGTFAGGVNTVATNASGVAIAATFTANGRAGSYSLHPSIPGQVGAIIFLTNTPGPPASITAIGGTPQTVMVSTSFQQLQAMVADSFGNPLSGVMVTFVAPGSGPSAKFFDSANTAITGPTPFDGNIIAALANTVANGITGSYAVTASAPGVPGTATFVLTNESFGLTMDTPGTVQITRGVPAAVKIDFGTVPVNSPLPLTLNVTSVCVVPTTLISTTCSLNPSAMRLVTPSGSTTLTIVTTAASATNSKRAPGPSGRGPSPLDLPWLFTAGLFAMMAVSLFPRWQGDLRLRRWPIYLLVMLLAITSPVLVSCGGGGTSGTPGATTTIPPVNISTPTGPSNITIRLTFNSNSGLFASITTTIPINVN